MQINKMKNIMKKQGVLGMTVLALASSGVATAVITFTPLSIQSIEKIAKADDISGSAASKVDFLPSPQRWVVSPDMNSQMTYTATNTQNLGYFKNPVSVHDPLWYNGQYSQDDADAGKIPAGKNVGDDRPYGVDTDPLTMAIHDEYNKSGGSVYFGANGNLHGNYVNASGMVGQSVKTTGNTLLNVHKDSVVNVNWANAGTIDGVPVTMHVSFSDFNPIDSKASVGNWLDQPMNLIVSDNVSTFVAFVNMASAIKVSFSYDQASRWGAAGTTVPLQGDGDLRGPVYITWGSLSFNGSANPNHNDTDAREQVGSNDINDIYFDKTTQMRIMDPVGALQNYPIKKVISGDGDKDISSGVGISQYGGADATSNWANWGAAMGVTFSVDKDTPTFYAGRVSTPGHNVSTNENHLMLTATTAAKTKPRATPPAPTKTVVNGGNANIDGKVTSTADSWIFKVSQTLTKQPYQQYYYDKLHFEDSVPATAKLQGGYKVVDETGKDVSSNFTIATSGNKITADANETWLNDYNTQGHTYTLIIPTIVNLDDQTKTADQLKTDNIATVSVDDNPQTSNHVTVSPKFNTPSAKKTVSVNDGKTWVTDAKTTGHDSLYDYKVDYVLSDHVQYATLQLRDYVEDLQSIGKVTITDAAGNDVTGDFTITGLPAAGSNTDGKKAQATVTATAKNAAQYARVGGTLTMTLSDVTLKGSGAQDDINYLDGDTIKIPNIADMYWQDTTPDPKEPNTLKSNKTNVTPPTPVNPENPNNPQTPIVTKQVSLDDGKTWTDPTDLTPAQLVTHDSEYTWMTSFNLTNYFNFDGAGSLKLVDHFENLQKYSNVKIIQGADSEGNGGTDITDKFDISEKATSDTQKDIIASVKAANADDFDDIGGTKAADLANVKMIITGTTVKGATASQELNYLTKDGNVDIPNISTLTEDDNVTTDYYKRNKNSNASWIRLARVEPMADKYVEQDGDSSLVNNQESDVNAFESAAAESSADASYAKGGTGNSEDSSSISSESEEPSTTDTEMSNSSSSSSYEIDDNLTVNDAIDFANGVLSSLDNMATPYPDSVNKASDSLIDVAGNRTSSANDIKKAAVELQATIEAAIKDGSLKEAK